MELAMLVLGIGLVILFVCGLVFVIDEALDPTKF
jgi:hypothetical protein